MLKKLFTLVLGIIFSSATVVYFYVQHRSTKVTLSPDEKYDAGVFFDFAKEQLPKRQEELDAYLKNGRTSEGPNLFELEDRRNLYKTVTAIANKDIQTLQAMPKDELEYKDGQLWVPGKRFKNQFDGLLVSRILGSKNALFFVIYHALLNASETDNQQTLAMLKVLLEKGLNPNTLCGGAYFVKDNPDAEYAPDFVNIMTLYEATDRYFPIAHGLLKQFGIVKKTPEELGYLSDKKGE